MRSSANELNSLYIGGGIVRITRDFGDATPSVTLLSRLGSAAGLANDAAVALSGQWSREPTVAVGLTDIMTYSPGYNASQEIEAEITGLEYAAGGIYRVRAHGNLVTSGGQYIWGVNETIPAGDAYNSWHYSVNPPAQTYTFSWYGAGSDMESLSVKLGVWSERDAPPDYTKYISVADVYIDYIEQSSGVQRSQLARTVELSGIYMEQVLLNDIRLNSLASNVRVRVVMRNGAMVSSSFYQGDSVEKLWFYGGAIYKSPGTARIKIYGGTLHALAVGR